MTDPTTVSDKVPPIDKLPVELRMHIYKFRNVRDLVSSWPMAADLPWASTIIVASILNDWEALAIVSIQPYNYGKFICELIALVGMLDALKWARYQSKTLPPDIFIDGETGEEIPVERFPWDASTCQNAILGCHVDVLKWAKEHGCPLDSLSSYFAAMTGQDDLLKWLHEQDCPWNQHTAAMVAKRGKLELLQWMHQQGCPIGPATFADASNHGRIEVMDWLYEQGVRADWMLCASLAFMGGHLEAVVTWMANKGINPPDNGIDEFNDGDANENEEDEFENEVVDQDHADGNENQD